MEKKRDLKLVTWRQVVLMFVAATGGIGLNAYRTYKSQGHLDVTWVAVVSLAVIGAIFFFVIRHANRPEKED